MGAQRHTTIAEQHPAGLTAPAGRSEGLWSRVYKIEAHAKQKGRCAYCREPVPRRAITADHVVPRIRGGLTKAENIKAACEDCNSAKGAMPEARFKKVIRAPHGEHAIAILLVNFRLRLWTAEQRAQRRILAAVGLPAD